MISILASLDVSFFLKLYQFEIKVSLYQWGEQSYGLGSNFGLQNGLTSCNIFRLTTGISHKVGVFGIWLLKRWRIGLPAGRNCILQNGGKITFITSTLFSYQWKKRALNNSTLSSLLHILCCYFGVLKFFLGICSLSGHRWRCFFGFLIGCWTYPEPSVGSSG